MKYLVFEEDVKNGLIDGDTVGFESLEEAEKYALSRWEHLTRSERRKFNVVVLESANPDEEAANHYDGEIIWESEQN